MWRPFGPTTSSTSASISSCRTPSPTPTDSANSPSLAAPASSPSASSTDWGSPSMLSWLAATDAADTVLMRLVLLSSWTWFRTHHGPNGTGRGGRTAAIKFYELRDKLVCADEAGHAKLRAYAQRFGDEREWAIEDCRNLSRRLERAPLEGGE